MLYVNPLQRRLIRNMLLEDFRWLKTILSSQSVKSTLNIDAAEKEALAFANGDVKTVAPMTKKLVNLMFEADLRFWRDYMIFFTRRKIGIGSWASLPYLVQIMRLEEFFIDQINKG